MYNVRMVDCGHIQKVDKHVRSQFLQSVGYIDSFTIWVTHGTPPNIHANGQVQFQTLTVVE